MANDAVRIVELTDLPQAEPNCQLVEFLHLRGKTLLIYQVNPYVPTPAKVPSFVLVDLGHCLSLATGPNDEALHNHPLARHGLQAYAIQEVVNSPWRRERAAIHDKDRRSSRFDDYRHIVFAFKEGMLECLTRGWRLAGTYPTFEDAVHAAVGLALG